MSGAAAVDLPVELLGLQVECQSCGDITLAEYTSMIGRFLICDPCLSDLADALGEAIERRKQRRKEQGG